MNDYDNKYCIYCNSGLIFKREIATKALFVFRCGACPAGEWPNRVAYPMWQRFKQKDLYRGPDIEETEQVGDEKADGVSEQSKGVGEGVGKPLPEVHPVQRVPESGLPGLGDPKDWPS